MPMRPSIGSGVGSGIAIMSCVEFATAPALEHPDEVLDIRGLAHIFIWSKLGVSSVLRMVERSTLTAAEAEWLIASIGRDAEPPNPSSDF